jgi:hypothetical protein
MAIADVDLRDLRATPPTRVLDRKRHRDIACRPGNRELAVLKCRVRQTEAEWEQRLDAGSVEMAVAQMDAFRVRDAMRARLELVTIRGRAVFEAAFERHR